MATNNYFGFTHGATQYGTTATGAYNQYPVAPASANPAGYTPRPGYDQQQAYQTAAANQGSYGSTGTPAPTYDYGYGRPAQTYDTSKTYYQQTAGYTGGAASYDGSGSAKVAGGYQAPTTYAQPRSAAKVTQYNAGGQQYVSQASYSQPPTNSAAVPKTAATANTPATYSNYDAALYSATMYVAQQGGAKAGGASATAGNQNWQYKKGAATATSGGGGGGAGASSGNGVGSGGPGGKGRYNKPQAKPQQLHYCEVCKISCAGPQTYREHLDGQKHKKRQAGLKLVSIGGSGNTGSRGNNMHCELCDVTCTGIDAFAAHVRGSKHQKVVKLHQKLGKPIPQQDLVQAKQPKINFVSESKPSMIVPGSEVVAPTPAGKAVCAAAAVAPIAGDMPATEEETASSASSFPQDEVKPVGLEYIEEISEEGKIISFNCKLCDCKFNDPNAKEMHMKGRRHRMQYKKKVQPDLVVDIKPSPRRLKLAEAKVQREMWNRRRMGGSGEEGMMEDDREMLFWDERRRYEEECWLQRGFSGGGGGGGGPMGRGGMPMGRPGMPHPFGMPFGGPGSERRPESSDDRHVVARHAEIYPKEEELQVIQRIVSHTERALKFVSDALAGPDPEKKAVEVVAAPAVAVPETTETPKAAEGEQPAGEPAAAGTATATATTPAAGAKSVKEDGRDNQMFSFQKDADGNVRVLKGVMRVGLLAKGLLLQGDNIVQLVVLCAEKPTQSLLRRVANELPVQLAKISTEHSYTVTVEENEGAVIVTDDQITVKVSLTSPVLREQHQHDNVASATTSETPAATEQATVGSADDLLPREPCLAALAALRHAKWFQARATVQQSCVMVMRVFRDLCQRTPTWSPVPQWAMELFIEKVIVSAGIPLSPGDCMRRIMEAVASGIFINGPGILDPCEKEPTDALASLSKQQREDITVSGQHFLRLIAFRQIYTVLGMNMLPLNKFHARPNVPWKFARKRRRSGTDGAENEEAGAESSTGKIVKTEAVGGEAGAVDAAAKAN